MPRALEVAKDGWDELGLDLAGAPTKSESTLGFSK